MGGFHLNPGDSMSWTWDQKWHAWDPNGQELNKGMYIPQGLYIVLAEALVGFPIPDLVEIARSRFTIGDCMAQITAGDDITVGENESFQFHPRIDITGDASITSVTWDLDPAVDSNGDGNPTNDIDLAGRNPTYAFGDDGTYSVVMNVRGFGKISGMDRPAQDTIFTTDSSDSMVWRDQFDHRKIAVKDYVDWMVPDDRGAVVDMDAVGRLVRGDHLGMDYTRIKSNVDTIDSAGGLYLASGLFVSLYELRDRGDKAHRWIIIFLTGADTENPRDPFYIPRAIDLAKDLGVTVYTVGLSIVETDSIKMMKTIASETGGKYFTAATASNLRQIYDDIAADANTSQGSYFTVNDSLSVTVDNTPPAASIATSEASANVTLRVAGEKYHDVSLSLLRDGSEIANAAIVRMPGSPDDQAVTLGAVAFDVTSTYEARVEYTPADDPVNGQENGANPAWLILAMPDGTNVTFHHVFNVGDPDTYSWMITDLQRPVIGGSLALVAAIADPGSDDVTIAWDWGDGLADVRTVFNDGVGPDPYPSPWGPPVSLTDIGAHTYAAAGTYAVSLTVTDDDGGSTVLSFSISVG
ncbi:MAG TPA: VWA domain-containing protein, partial [Thermoplasmata archaeon]|nr:VWA domain-containing protein [Thermoplasmata archaeon]